MDVVLDPNVLVVLTTGDPRKSVAQQVIRRWIANGDEIHAPALLPYEVASGLTRLVSAGALSQDQLADAWMTISRVPITFHQLEVGVRAVEIALNLRRNSAYDANYILLAQELNAELWTLDGPLYRNAAALGFSVHLITT